MDEWNYSANKIPDKVGIKITPSCTVQFGVIEKGRIYSIKITDRVEKIPFSVYERRIPRDQLENIYNIIERILEIEKSKR